MTYPNVGGVCLGRKFVGRG